MFCCCFAWIGVLCFITYLGMNMHYEWSVKSKPMKLRKMKFLFCPLSCFYVYA